MYLEGHDYVKAVEVAQKLDDPRLVMKLVRAAAEGLEPHCSYLLYGGVEGENRYLQIVDLCISAGEKKSIETVIKEIVDYREKHTFTIYSDRLVSELRKRLEAPAV
ncbi:MAG: hypothetical protein ABSE71_05355 [Candidatus Micrarchaeaceae archaeon]|nr:hypothetical protein [Candidatus Micrarchaeota archaeon]